MDRYHLVPHQRFILCTFMNSHNDSRLSIRSSPLPFSTHHHFTPPPPLSIKSLTLLFISHLLSSTPPSTTPFYALNTSSQHPLSTPPQHPSQHPLNTPPNTPSQHPLSTTLSTPPLNTPSQQPSQHPLSTPPLNNPLNNPLNTPSQQPSQQPSQHPLSAPSQHHYPFQGTSKAVYKVPEDEGNHNITISCHAKNQSVSTCISLFRINSSTRSSIVLR